MLNKQKKIVEVLLMKIILQLKNFIKKIYQKIMNIYNKKKFDITDNKRFML